MDKKLLQKRFWAFYVDLLSILIIDQVFMKSYMTFLQSFFYRMPSPTQIIFFKKFHQSASINFFIIYCCYYFAFELATNGQTFGKMLLGIKVFNSDQSNLKWWQSATRSILSLLNYMLAGLPSLILFATQGKIGPAEYASKTFVANEDYFIIKMKEDENSEWEKENLSQLSLLDYIDVQSLNNLHYFEPQNDPSSEDEQAA